MNFIKDYLKAIYMCYLNNFKKPKLDRYTINCVIKLLEDEESKLLYPICEDELPKTRRYRHSRLTQTYRIQILVRELIEGCE